MTNKSIKENFFDANGVMLNYIEGPDNGPALLLIPGQSATWENYHLQVVESQVSPQPDPEEVARSSEHSPGAHSEAEHSV